MITARARKMADRIQVIVAKTLERGIKDPRLGFVTITDVKVTGDLQHASVFYTVYGSDEERADSAAALKSATGMLRSEVGKNLTVRLTPSLEFIADARPREREAHRGAARRGEQARPRGGRTQEDRELRGRRGPLRQAEGHPRGLTCSLSGSAAQREREAVRLDGLGESVADEGCERAVALGRIRPEPVDALRRDR